MKTTWFEQGVEEGLEQGRREMLELMLEERFGPLGDEIRSRIRTWPEERLSELARAILKAQSLEELRWDT